MSHRIVAALLTLSWCVTFALASLVFLFIGVYLRLDATIQNAGYSALLTALVAFLICVLPVVALSTRRKRARRLSREELDSSETLARLADTHPLVLGGSVFALGVAMGVDTKQRTAFLRSTPAIFRSLEGPLLPAQRRGSYNKSKKARHRR